MKRILSIITAVVMMMLLAGCSAMNDRNEYVAPTGSKSQKSGEQSKGQAADKPKVRISKVTVTGTVNLLSLALLDWNVANSRGRRMPGAGEWVLTYDDNNNLLSKKSVSDEGGYTCDINYTYDSDNNVLSETIITNGSVLESVSYTYFASGEVESSTRIFGNGRPLKTTYDIHGNPLSYVGESSSQEYSYTYDNNGNILEQIYVFKEGGNSGRVVTTKTVYTYDDKGNKLTMNGQTGASTFSGTWEYDDNGNLIHSTSTTDNVKESTCVYNSNGKKISQTDVSQLDGKETTYTWEYNEMGKATVQKINGKVKTMFKYDASGNLTWKREPDSNITYSYEYYANGEVKNKTLHKTDSHQEWSYDEYNNLTEYTAEEYKGDNNHYKVVFEYEAI